jgi:hypothetical protein
MGGYALPVLGAPVRCRATGIDGIVVCHEVWLDRTPRVGIQREGVDQNGMPWEIHWQFPRWLETV